MTESVFVKSTEKQDLDAFSSKLSVLLGINLDEVRYSDHVAGGRYRRGYSLGLSITVEEADLADLPDYDFELVLEARLEYRDIEDAQMISRLADFVAGCLSKSDFQVARL
jgi:hypothetical protein